MEREKIIYYYPMQERNAGRNRAYAAKRRWFQEAELDAQNADEITGVCEAGRGRGTDGMSGSTGAAVQSPEFQVIGCVIPPYYYRNRAWKPQILSEAMERVPRRVDGMTDTWLHPQIAALLTEEYEGRFTTRRETVQMVAAQIIRQYAARTVCACGEAVVLLGEPADTDLQMQMTRELLLPYLPRINRLLIFYEEIAETDIWMELGSHLDEYYYEYGLVPQLEPYVTSYGTAAADVCAEPQHTAGEQAEKVVQQERCSVLKCGKPRCGGMILDYSRQFRYPKIMPESKAVYIDIVSEAEKERLLGRKTPWIPYISPLKYLDTIVKSGYDS